MNSKERFKRALHCHKTDYVPAGSFFNCDYKTKLIDVHPYEFLFGGADIKISAIFALAKKHQEDWIQCDPSLAKNWIKTHTIEYGSNNKAWIVNKENKEKDEILIDMTFCSSRWNSQFVPGSAMGFSFSEMDVPRFSVNTRKDVEDNIKISSADKIIEDERLITISATYKKYGNNKYLMFWAGNLLFNSLYFFGELDDGLVATISTPELFNALLDCNLQQELEAAKAGKRLGGDGVWMAEMLASSDMISPDFYKKNIFPRQKEFVAGVHALGLDVFIYQTGNVMTSLEFDKKLGVDAIIMENDDKTGGMIDVGKVREAAGNDIALFGNIHPVYELEKGSKEQVRKELLRQFKVAGKNGGFIAHSNIIPVTAKAENIDEMINTAKECTY